MGVPFVGLIAATLVIAELLRRLNGGNGLELVSGSVAALEDFETASMLAQPYEGGYILADQGQLGKDSPVMPERAARLAGAAMGRLIPR